MTLPPLLSANHYLGARIAAGLLVFAALALVDLRKNGRAATRWREYAFLLTCVAMACVYGAVNDQVSVTISWEYFYYGKELVDVLGPLPTPDGRPAEMPLRLQAAWIGIQATWSAGLIVGAALLLANNPMRRARVVLPRLAYLTLSKQLLRILGLTVVYSAVGAAAGYLGWLTWASDEFLVLLNYKFARPYPFMAAWGEHMGAYVGGLAGTVLAVRRVWKLRRRQGAETHGTVPVFRQDAGPT